MKFRNLIALFYLLLASAAVGATTNSWFARSWRTDDGLPDNAISGLAQTPDGFLWVGTPSGLVRFDGARFERFSPLNIPGVPNRVVRAMTLDHQGRLWLGMDRGVAICVDSARTRVFGATNGLPDLVQKTMTVDGGGAVWISYVGYRDGVSRIKDGRVTYFTSQDGLPTTGQCRLATDIKGRLWFAKGNSVGVFRDGRFQTLLTLDENSASIAAARSGGVWICTPNRLLKYDGHGSPKQMGLLPQPGFGAGVMLEDETGALWMGTGLAYGLFRFDGRNFERVPTSHPVINCLLEDHEGNLWVGTGGGGLDRLRPRILTLLNAGNAQPFDSIRSISEDASGALWAVDRDGFLTRQQGGAWTTLNSRSDWPGGHASCVAAGHDGKVWIGTRGTGLYEFQSNQFKVWRHRSSGLASDYARSLLVSSNGDLWIAADSPRVLQRLHKGNFKTFKLPANARSIRALAEDASGNIWAASAEGLLFRISAGHLINETTNDLSRPMSIRCLCATSDGSLWIGYADGWGLGRLKDGKYSRITTAQGLNDDYISQIIADDQGWLWMGGSHGFFRVRLSQLENVADGGADHVRSIVFGRGEGLPGLQAYFDNYPAAFFGRDGRLRIATRTGVLVIDTANLRDNPDPPPVFIERVAVDGKTIGLYGGHSPLRAPQNRDAFDLRQSVAEPELPPDYRKIEFDFTALSFTAPANVQFRYKLDGFDDGWIEAGAERSAVYSRLPAGTYHFHVVACNNSGVWNQTGATLAFIVRPFLWQTWWFQTVAVILFTLAVVAVVRYVSFRRLRFRLRLLEQQSALDKERARIARDLHDDLGGSLTQVGLLLEMTRRNGSPPEKTNADVQKCSSMVRRVATSVDEIIWAINPRNDTAPYLVDYISQFVVEFLHAAGIQCRVDLPNDIPACHVSPEARHNLFLVVKESLNNIARHAQATEVRFRVAIDHGQLAILIEDNGRGFRQSLFGRVEPNTPALRENSTTSGNGASSGNGSARTTPGNSTADGLRNMRQRMEEIGGQFQIESAPGGGTRVCFLYQLPRR